MQLALVAVVVHPADHELARRVRAQIEGEDPLLDLALFGEGWVGGWMSI